MKRFCSMCGSQFEAMSGAERYCPDCKEKVKSEWKEKQKAYAKQRAEKLGLVNVSIYKDDREILKERALQEKTTIAEVIKALLTSEVKQEEVKQEAKQEEESAKQEPKKESAKKKKK